MALVELRDDRMCFACGKENPDGLGLEFREEDGDVVTSFAFPKRFQGYRNVVHGGLIATVLDEAMVTALNRSGRLAVIDHEFHASLGNLALFTVQYSLFFID